MMARCFGDGCADRTEAASHHLPLPLNSVLPTHAGNILMPAIDKNIYQHMDFYAPRAVRMGKNTQNRLQKAVFQLARGLIMYSFHSDGE
jgi:hypothetical protein